MSVKLYDIWAIPYSLINQPIPFTDLNKPGSLSGSPSFPFIIFPDILPPSLFILPASRMSNATALALLVDVVFRLTLYATKKSRAAIAVAPDFSTDLLNSAGPKSGFHFGSMIFLDSPSYSPWRQLAKFFLFYSFAASS